MNIKYTKKRKQPPYPRVVINTRVPPPSEKFDARGVRVLAIREQQRRRAARLEHAQRREEHGRVEAVELRAGTRIALGQLVDGAHRAGQPAVPGLDTTPS